MTWFECCPSEDQKLSYTMCVMRYLEAIVDASVVCASCSNSFKKGSPVPENCFKYVNTSVTCAKSCTAKLKVFGKKDSFYNVIDRVKSVTIEKQCSPAGSQQRVLFKDMGRYGVFEILSQQNFGNRVKFSDFATNFSFFQPLPPFVRHFKNWDRVVCK
ncbi:hypothetical protein HELRODRAFT_183807 [Helobdella robusta]|uniref:Uncharacterized protein n=1 Tax=Helobdella robusta TaxID=6412 RepID=T1FK80_HELRO|nr:hypothetical protein HELRODRAFT_183807 [Helobdella robusta]ESO10281.1 hypothetical protein HELRODRAFT_183807 [Helobdella robusta]